MKPRRIILVRHGESEGNVDWGKHEYIPDYALNLTARGRKQAVQAGEEIRATIREETIHAYVSPYYRTRQTFEEVARVLGSRVVDITEDPRLREQDWGHLRSQEAGDQISKDRDNYGTFYYRIPDGESGADVYDRISTALETLHRDFQKVTYPDNCLIVTHGLTLRLFLMRWFRWSVEEFEGLKNPNNGQIVIMTKENSGKYWLDKKLLEK